MLEEVEVETVNNHHRSPLEQCARQQAHQEKRAEDSGQRQEPREAAEPSATDSVLNGCPEHIPTSTTAANHRWESSLPCTGHRTKGTGNLLHFSIVLPIMKGKL
jgi:hypothetical protein